MTKSFRSAEKAIDSSSSDDEAPPSQRQMEGSPSRISSSSLSRSRSPVSSPVFSSRPPTRTPSPDRSSYRYAPPPTHELSKSTYPSALPKLRASDELFLLRIPKGVSLQNMRFNFKRRKVRVGDEEWKLMSHDVASTRIIQPQENSHKYEFGTVQFSSGLSIIRDVELPASGGKSIGGERSEKREKKRKRDGNEKDREKQRNHQDKPEEFNGEEKEGRHKRDNKEQREKDKHRHKEGKNKKNKGDKHSKHLKK